ncbi:hypothetical protein [Clostridium sp. UBA4548]|uniref:hypothetical protein n=1 Tax=Clostridium sp. UBA4548 TaxID=1946361 RepID=UPI0025B7E328|nr:hypothetical protein [Clostridium sp. UBA4548]
MDEKSLQTVRELNAKSRKNAQVNSNKHSTQHINSSMKNEVDNTANFSAEEDINEVNSLNNISSMVSMDYVDSESFPTNK